MTRQEALNSGAKRYTGKPCKYCGNPVRYTCNGDCVECSLVKSRRYNKTKPRFAGWPELRRLAHANGETYYLGTPCKNDGNALRYTSDGACVWCKQRRNADYRPIESARKKAMKQRLVAERGGACEQCGIKVPLPKFHFHHVDESTKEGNVAHLLNGTYQRAKHEADKCMLVCDDCHYAMHYEDYNKMPWIGERRDSDEPPF